MTAEEPVEPISGFPPLPAEGWGEAEYDAFGKVLGVPGSQVPRVGSGHPHDPLNFDVIGVMVRHPGLADAFFRYNTWLLRRGALPARLRELGILRAAQLDRAAYVWAEHVRMAFEAGVAHDEIRSLGAGNTGFDGDDRLVLETTDELVAEGHLDPDSWERLRSRLGTHAAMELLFVIGWYRTLSSALSTWGLAPEPADVPLPPPPPTAGTE